MQAGIYQEIESKDKVVENLPSLLKNAFKISIKNWKLESPYLQDLLYQAYLCDNNNMYAQDAFKIATVSFVKQFFYLADAAIPKNAMEFELLAATNTIKSIDGLAINTKNLDEKIILGQILSKFAIEHIGIEARLIDAILIEIATEAKPRIYPEATNDDFDFSKITDISHVFYSNDIEAILSQAYIYANTNTTHECNYTHGSDASIT
ncbi:MAG: hypothetical protein U9Q15_04200 [Patescibacteria group bacterium]|nr:hypothetical protein [Patescibacteria group bacterium]